MAAEVEPIPVGLSAEQDVGRLVEQLQGGDELKLQQLATELYQRGTEAGGAEAADVAEVVDRLLQELPPEQGRVLRRLLLQAAHAHFESANADGSLRLGVCQLLCELYLADVVPETVLHDCLESCLWDIRDPRLSDIECVCLIMQSVGSQLDSSDLEAAGEIMSDFFERLRQLSASGVLPFDQHQMVNAVLRQRASRWAEADMQEGAPVVALPAKGVQAEDWRAVLDAKKTSAAGNGVQDSARKAGFEAAPAAADGSGAELAVGADVAPAGPSLEESKQQAVQQLLAAAPNNGASWSTAQLAQQVQESALDVFSQADAELLLPPLLNHAAAAGVAAAGSSTDSANGNGNGTSTANLTSSLLPPPVEGCAELVAELTKHAPAVSAAASTHLVGLFKQRAQARSPAARQLLAQQMLLAGALALRGVLPEAQLHALLEQLARQVMKPTPSDVVCLCALLRGANRLTETKKGGWWKAAQQLASSPNVSPDQQRELRHLLLLKACKWDAAAAAAAAAEQEARSKAEEAEAALAQLTLERQAQEEALTRAKAELAATEEKIKAGAARLAELEQAAAQAEATAEKARRAQQQAESGAASAAARRAECDRAAAAAKKQVQEAQGEVARAKLAASAAAAAPSGGSGSGGQEEKGRHWYYATVDTGDGPHGPLTAAELVAWQYQDIMLGGEIQVIRAHEATWQRLEERLPEIQAELPPMPHKVGRAAATPTMPPAGGRGGRGAGRGGRFAASTTSGRGGRGGRGGSFGGQPPSTDFPQEFMPPAQAGSATQQPGGRGGRGRGREAGRGGRAGRGRGELQQQQQQPQNSLAHTFNQAAPQRAVAPPAQPSQAPRRADSPPRFAPEDMFPYASAGSAAQPHAAAAPSAVSRPASGDVYGYTGGGYNPMGLPRSTQQASAAAPATPAASSIDLCPICFTRAAAHFWLPCGHRGHCSECLLGDVSIEMSDADLLANCPFCMVCNKPATAYMRM